MKEELLHNRIIADFQDGNTRGLNDVFELFFASLCYFSYRLIKDRLEAEDIAITSFLRLWAKNKDFNHLKSIKMYLYVTAKNSCIDYLRKQKKIVIESETYLNTAQFHEPGAEQCRIKAEIIRFVYNEIDKLPERCRVTFMLLMIDGVPVDEVASVMGVSVSTVYNQKMRALVFLRKSLKGMSSHML